METEVKLTKLATCAGCGAKVGAGTLVHLLEGFRTHTDPNLIVGFDRSDDASVYRLDDSRALVQTTDFFPPIVDDPYLYGQIAATNALSDVYAMGGTPKLALNIMCVSDKMDKDDPRPRADLRPRGLRLRGSRARADEQRRAARRRIDPDETARHRHPDVRGQRRWSRQRRCAEADLRPDDDAQPLCRGDHAEIPCACLYGRHGLFSSRAQLRDGPGQRMHAPYPGGPSSRPVRTGTRNTPLRVLRSGKRSRARFSISSTIRRQAAVS